MALNFPNPDTIQTYTNAGITWTWNPTLGVWSTEGNTSDNEFLSKVNDDTAAGVITFEARTTHEGGVRVSGGSIDDVFTGFYNSGGDLITTNRQFRVAQFGNSEKSVGISCNPNGKMSNTENLAISLIESTYGYGSHGVQELSLFRGAYTANTNCKGSTNCFTAEFRVNQTGANNRAVGFYSKVDSGDSLNGDAYGFYAEGNAPNYFAGNMEFGCPTVFTSTALNHRTKFLSSSTFKAATGVGSNTGQGAFEVMAVNTGSGANNAFVFTDTTGVDKAVTRGSIKITASGTNFNETSDYRLKSNILALPSATNLVKQLNPVSFDINGINRRGFIAHELQAVEPLAVDGVKDETEIVGTYTHADGVIQTEVSEPETIPYGATWEQTGTRDVYQSVDQSKLIPLLTKALQEALARIEELESNTLQPLYSTFADLPSASEHHGKTAHVHDEGALYFAHAGNWVKLQNA